MLNTALFRPLFSLFLLFIAIQTPAQNVVFSDEPGAFVNQLGDFMTASKRPDMEEAFTVFKNQYKTGSMTPAEMKRMMGVCTRMSQLKLAAFPYFKNYVNALTTANASPDSTLFDKWHAVTERVFDAAESGKTKPIGQFLEFSHDFLSSKALKTGEGGSVTWRVKGGQYQFDFIDSSKTAALRCTNIDLIGLRKKDSVTVYQTSGVYFPATNRWIGDGGSVNWRDVGLDSSVFATLSRYVIDANKPLFHCDTALLTYPLYFGNTAMMGKLEHNVVVDAKEGTEQYPRFESFDKKININKLGEGVEYTGGFKLWGSSLYGYGSGSEAAQLTVYNKKRQKVFYGRSQLYVIRREKSIVSEEVDAKIFMQDGTQLLHPGAYLRLDLVKQHIVMERGTKGSQRNPFFSSFYNMNLDAERVAYLYNADSLEIGAQVAGRKGIRQAVGFESSNLYDPSVMQQFQHQAEKNPIVVLYLLGLKTGKKDTSEVYVVSDDDFARELNAKWDRSSIQTLLAQMVEEGFINYYFEQREIVLRDKLIHYALASSGKKDFDAINIESVTNETNAVYNGATKETTINEVKRLELSNRQHVAVSPSDKQLVLLKNRDMRLSGRLFGGYALFEGRNMAFNYDKFDITFDSVKNLDFYLPFGEKDPNTGLRPAKAMNSTIEYVSGVLLVDAPNNKSGKEDLEMFPSMQSKKNSFVYYERPETQGGAYKRDSFFFKLDPFSFNQLDNYEPEQLKFKGEMRPASIFPPFRETIVVRPDDQSFGFVHTTPPAGYSTYLEKGKYRGSLDLSNKGFLGKGTLEYLTADIESEDLVFKPKQTTGTARKFFMEEDRAGDVKTPEARGEAVKVNWLPFRDSMYVESKAKDFSLFKASGYNHKGLLILTPDGLKGRGQFEWAGGILTSKLISYGPFQAGADTADLQIKALSGNDIAFDSKNIDGQLDFDAQLGKFKANSADATTTLPLDQYRTSMNEFDWDMKAQTITFKSDPNKPAIFVSTAKDRDQLSFLGKTATYDMRTNLLKIGGVEVIKSADAFIYPETGDIEIVSGGAMKQLANARIVADTVSKYHTITRATVDIIGKKLYKAKGYYQYNIPGYEQEVFFDNILGERVGKGDDSQKPVLTSASGPIKEEAGFRMDQKVFFKGDIKLEANKPNLRFEGMAKLDTDKLPKANWFSVYSDVDKNDPVIRIKNAEIPDPTGENDTPLITGIYVGREEGECYPRILQPHYDRRDRALIDAQFVMKYDPKTDRFFFGDSSKVVGGAKRGPYMIFDNRVGTLVAEGKIDIGSGLEYMKIKSAGRLRTDFNRSDSTAYQIDGEIMSGAEIILPPKLAELLIANLRAATYDAPNAIYTAQSSFYNLAVPEFISDPKMDATIANDLKNNLILIPKAEDKFAFLLGMHKVTWNPEYHSFLSVDDKLPLISINGEQFNKVMTAYVEYHMPGNEADRFKLYLAPTNDLFYYFSYQAGALGVTSNDTKFMETLSAMKTKDLQFKMPDGELYEVLLVNQENAGRFVEQVKAGRKKQ